MFTDGDEGNNIVLNQVKAAAKLFTLQPEKFENPYDFKFRYNSMRQACEYLGMNIGKSTEGTKEILKRQNIQQKQKSKSRENCSRRISCKFVQRTCQ